MIDALLGAAGGGDIGTLFPDDDERWRDADSIDLLRTVVGTIAGRDRQHRRDPDLRAAAARPLQGGDGADPRRGHLGPGQRQGDEQRGHGLDRPRRGNRLHRGRFGRERIVFAAAMANARARSRQACGQSVSDVDLRGQGPARGGHPRRRCAPTRRPRSAATFLRWGASPATGVATAAIHHPHEIGDHRRARLAQLRAAAPPLQRPRPRLRGDGDRLRRRGRDHVPQPPRLRRGDPGRGQARRQRALPEHDVRRPAAGRGDARARARRRSSTTRSSPACSTGVDDARRRGSSAGRDGERPTEPTLDALIAAGDESDLKPPPDKPRFVILTSGTTGTPEGRPALQPRRAAGDRGADRQDPLPQPRDDDDRGAALPLLGLLPLRR